MNWTEILRHYDEIKGVHPAADLFPMVEGDEFRDLCADIKERGLAQPITVDRDGLLLDGRNRLMACFETNQEVLVDDARLAGPVAIGALGNPLQNGASVAGLRHLVVGVVTGQANAVPKFFVYRDAVVR